MTPERRARHQQTAASVKFPGVKSLNVEGEKITGYLLNPAHPDNGGKAAFFVSLGFSSGKWENLAIALSQSANTAAEIKIVESSHGRKYIADGRIETPSGKQPTVRTVWILETGRAGARLVTAYPHQGAD